MERILFYTFGGLAVVASFWMVTRRNALASALSLVVVFLALAALYAVLHAHLLFAVQLWVYAGAVMVLVLFVIMLLNLREEEQSPKPIGLGRFVIGLVVVAGVGWKVLAILGAERGDPPALASNFGGVAAVAEILFSRYVLQFEVVSVLLLVVIVAVVVLAKRRL